jgi:hypothetical protein
VECGIRGSEAFSALTLATIRTNTVDATMLGSHLHKVPDVTDVNDVLNLGMFHS